MTNALLKFKYTIGAIMTNYNELNKKQLIKLIEDQDQIILDLQIKLESSNNQSGRKSQVLELLKSNESISILELSKELNISTKNVSSQLTYLRTDGYKICTNESGRKFLLQEVEKSEELKKTEKFLESLEKVE